jgi:hypothetical protein
MATPVVESEAVASTMGEMVKKIPSNGLFIDANAVKVLTDQLTAVELTALEPFTRKQAITTTDDRFGRVAEMTVYEKTTPTAVAGVFKTQKVQLPSAEPCEGTWTNAELVARMIPYLPTTQSHLNYSSLGVPAVNIGDVNAPITVAHETVLVFQVALGINLLELPELRSEEAVSLYNERVAHIVVGVARNGERKIKPTVVDAKVTGFVSSSSKTKDAVVSLTPFIKMGFKNIQHFDASTDPLDGHLLVTPAPWFLRDVANVIQRMVGREQLSPEFVRVLALDAAGRKTEFNLKAVVDNASMQTYNSMVEKGVINDEVKSTIATANSTETLYEPISKIIRTICRAGWTPFPVRARTAFQHLIDGADDMGAEELEQALTSRNVLCLVAAKNAAPLWFNSLLRFGCADLEEEKMTGKELLSVCKTMKPALHAISLLACGKKVKYPTVIRSSQDDEEAAAAGGAAGGKKRARGKAATAAAAAAAATAPDTETAKVLGELKRSHDQLTKEFGELKAVVEKLPRKIRKIIANELSGAAAAPAAASVAAPAAAAPAVAALDYDDDVEVQDADPSEDEDTEESEEEEDEEDDE